MAVYSKVQASGYAMAGAAPLATLIAWLGPNIGIPPMDDHVIAAVASVLTAVSGWVSGYLKTERVYKTNPPARRISSQSKK